MKTKLLLTVLLLIITSIIISIGCGGGSGTNQPVSLSTPSTHTSGNMAYITIKVQWPEQGMAGNMIISSDNKKELTASMPAGSQTAAIKIFDFKDKDPNDLINFNDTILIIRNYKKIRKN